MDLCGFEETEAEHVPGWPKRHRETLTVGRACNLERSKVRSSKEAYYRDEVHTQRGACTISRIERPPGILDSSYYR